MTIAIVQRKVIKYSNSAVLADRNPRDCSCAALFIFVRNHFLIEKTQSWSTKVSRSPLHDAILSIRAAFQR